MSEANFGQFDRYDEVFIHYGSKQFDKNLFRPVKNKNMEKPSGGFWSSPINSENSWRELVETELHWYGPEYLDCNFKFKLKPGAKIFNISTVKELESLPSYWTEHRKIEVLLEAEKLQDYEKLYEYVAHWAPQFLDYEEIAKQYDGIYVDMSNNRPAGLTIVSNYDVDTLLIFNPDVVEQISEQTDSHKDISSLIKEEPQKALPPQEHGVKTLFSFNTKSKQLQDSYTNIALKKNSAFVTGFMKDDSMFVLAHGTKTGGVIAANDYGISTEFLSSILQEEGLIPENVKNIYTMSCYGGLQKPFEMPNGIKVQPLHTSNEKIKFGLRQSENGTSLKLGVTDDSDLSLSFKEKFKTQSGDSLDVDLVFTSEDFNKAFIDNKARHGALTAQEAFDKYGPDDDRFFTSQGLDPTKQRAKLKNTNKKRAKLKKTNKHSEPDPDITEEVMESVELESEIDTPTVESTFEDDMKNIVEEVAQETSGTTESTAKAAGSLPKKTLGGRGKVAIGIGVATLVAGGIAISSSASKKKKEQEQENHQQAHQQQYSYNNQMAIDNSYAMQMAQDISTYRYGKPMTGFVNH